MAALTSSGLWPTTEFIYRDAPAYGKVPIRQAVVLSPLQAATISSGPATTAPLASTNTSYPTNP